MIDPELAAVLDSLPLHDGNASGRERGESLGLETAYDERAIVPQRSMASITILGSLAGSWSRRPSSPAAEPAQRAASTASTIGPRKAASSHDSGGTVPRPSTSPLGG
jgi:hypothetical protein